jgi:hypothetical protein
MSLGWIETHSGMLDKIGDYLDLACHADVLLEVANS